MRAALLKDPKYLSKFKDEWLEYNTYLRKNGLGKPVTLVDFVAFRHGKLPVGTIVRSSNTIPKYMVPPGRTDNRHIPSHDSGIGVGAKKEVLKYTGTNMIGIGTLHKSNAIPIFNSEQAQSISQMRRN